MTEGKRKPGGALHMELADRNNNKRQVHPWLGNMQLSIAATARPMTNF